MISNDMGSLILKLSATAVFCWICYIYLFPEIIHLLLISNSRTLIWVGVGIRDLIYPTSSFTSTGVLSYFILPKNLFDLFFGTGHNIYAVEGLGFHSDVGYINIVWEYGIVGSFIFYTGNIKIFLRAYKNTLDTQKYTVIFLAVSYFAVSFKGVTLGYSPGSVVNYLMCFMLIYYGNNFVKE